jgi:hypothetical protein
VGDAETVEASEAKIATAEKTRPLRPIRRRRSEALRRLHEMRAASEQQDGLDMVVEQMISYGLSRATFAINVGISERARV